MATRKAKLFNDLELRLGEAYDDGQGEVLASSYVCSLFVWGCAVTKRVPKVILWAAIVPMMLVSCSRSRERETAKAFLARFDQVLEQSAALDKLDQETKPYDEQLEKALQQKDRLTAAKALGAWVAGYRALVQQARSILDKESALVDKMVSDSANFSAETGKYAREATDALREHESALKQGIETTDQLIAIVEDLQDADVAEVPELSKKIEDLDAKEQQAFQRAKDAIARLRAIVR